MRITALGEVAHPGALALEPPADLLQALALFGGPTEFADKSRIFVVRRFPEFRRIRFNYDAITQNQGGAAQFPLARATQSSSSSVMHTPPLTAG